MHKNTQCTLKNARKYTMHIWFNTRDYGIFGPIVFLERQKYTGKLTFGKVLIKKAWRARTPKKILKREALNVLYFQLTYCTICTCNVHKKYWPLQYILHRYALCTYCNTRTTHARSKYRPKRIVYNDFMSQFSIHRSYVLHHSTFVRLQYCTATHYNISYVLQHTHNTRTIEIHT